MHIVYDDQYRYRSWKCLSSLCSFAELHYIDVCALTKWCNQKFRSRSKNKLRPEPKVDHRSQRQGREIRPFAFIGIPVQALIDLQIIIQSLNRHLFAEDVGSILNHNQNRQRNRIWIQMIKLHRVFPIKFLLSNHIDSAMKIPKSKIETISMSLIKRMDSESIFKSRR